MKLSKLFILLILILAAVALYWGLEKVFFQQDEWSGFGRVIFAEKYGFLKLIRFSGSHFTPLTGLIVALFYKLFYLNPTGYAVFSIAMHAANSFLVFLVAKKLLKSYATAFVTSLVFLTASTATQTVSWYAASISYLPSTFFALLALLYFEYFLDLNKKKLLIWSTAFVLIATLFRENALFLFGYFIARMVITKNKNLWMVLALIILPTALYTLIRFVPVITILKSILPNMISHFVEFTIFYLPKLLVPETFLRFISNSIPGSPLQYIKWEYWTRITYAGVFLVSSFVLLLNSKKSLVISMIFFLLLSIVPLTFLPASYTMESRHFYLSAVGFSILIGYFFSKNKFTIVPILLFLLANVFFIRQDINKLTAVSRVRQSFIEQFQKLYPATPQKTIFLSQGEDLPFQTGFGQMAMVILHDKNDYADHLGRSYLNALGTEGYSEEGGVGFGYFKNFNFAKNEFCKAKLKKDNFFSFSWESQANKIEDTSKQTRLKMSCM